MKKILTLCLLLLIIGFVQSQIQHFTSDKTYIIKEWKNTFKLNSPVVSSYMLPANSIPATISVKQFPDSGDTTILQQQYVTLTLNAPITIAGSVSACPNESFNIPVTVNNFNQVGAITLRLDFDSTLIKYNDAYNINTSLSGIMINTINTSGTMKKINFAWTNIPSVSLPNGSKLFDLNFTLISGSPALLFNNTSNGGGDCEYVNDFAIPFNDDPTSTYYINPVITNTGVGNTGNISGPATICQGQSNVIYSIPAIPNATSYIWTLATGVGGTSSGNSITVDFNTSFTSGNITVKGHNNCGDGIPATLPVKIENKILQLKLFLEGLYMGNQQMSSALNEFGYAQWGNQIADKIIIELRDSAFPYPTVYTNSNVMLQTNGIAELTNLPCPLNGDYYIVIKNRNHIETWSALAVSVDTDTTYYDFSDSDSKVYGNNLKNIAIYNPINQIPDKATNISELKNYNYNPQRFTLLLKPGTNSDEIKVIVIDKITNKTYQKLIKKDDYFR